MQYKNHVEKAALRTIHLEIMVGNCKRRKIIGDCQRFSQMKSSFFYILEYQFNGFGKK